MKKSITLSPDQAAAFDKMVNMKAGDMLFLTGKAGSGKSTLVEEFCKKRPNVIKLASTGIAAQNIGGRTIHAFMGLRPGVWEINPESLKRRTGLSNFVLIDEVSMVNAQLMEFVVEKFNTYIEGMRFLFVGDFCQLPPVEGEFCHTSCIWDDVETIELTHIHRQHDMEFVNALNCIRDNNMWDPSVIKLIKERTVEEFPDDAVLVTPYRRITEDYNKERLVELGSRIYENEAGILKGNWKDNKVPKVVHYAKDARVLMLTNDPGGEWVNGSQGTITKADQRSVDIILDSGNWITVGIQEHSVLNGEGRAVLVFEQFPFQLGYAITIHKSQGMTLDQIAVDMERHFADGMTYVAMSRCRSKEGLYLLGDYYG